MSIVDSQSKHTSAVDSESRSEEVRSESAISESTVCESSPLQSAIGLIVGQTAAEQDILGQLANAVSEHRMSELKSHAPGSFEQELPETTMPPGSTRSAAQCSEPASQLHAEEIYAQIHRELATLRIQQESLSKEFSGIAVISEQLRLLHQGVREAFSTIHHSAGQREEQSRLRFEQQFQSIAKRLSDVSAEIAIRSNEILSRNFQQGLEKLSASISNLPNEIESRIISAHKVQLENESQESPRDEQQEQLLIYVQETAHASEIIAGAMHDLQGDLARLKSAVMDVCEGQARAPMSEVAQELQSVQHSLQSLEERFETQAKWMERAEMQRQIDALAPDEGGGKRLFFGWCVVLFLVINFAAVLAVYARQTTSSLGTVSFSTPRSDP